MLWYRLKPDWNSFTKLFCLWKTFCTKTIFSHLSLMKHEGFRPNLLGAICCGSLKRLFSSSKCHFNTNHLITPLYKATAINTVMWLCCSLWYSMYLAPLPHPFTPPSLHTGAPYPLLPLSAGPPSTNQCVPVSVSPQGDAPLSAPWGPFDSAALRVCPIIWEPDTGMNC